MWSHRRAPDTRRAKLRQIATDIDFFFTGTVGETLQQRVTGDAVLALNVKRHCSQFVGTNDLAVRQRRSAKGQ